MIAVILPTRGIVFTQVEKAIERMRQGKEEIQVFRSSSKPIPDAQNFLVQQALRTDATHLFFIEEDTVPPKGALHNLLYANADIACIDYAVNGWSCTARNRATDELLWCGFGCTLVSRKVLEKIGDPWFRTDKTLRLNDWQWVDKPAKYGGQDIWFCMKARSLGFKIKQVDGECEHLMLSVLGNKENNNGQHLVITRPKIEKQQYIDVPEQEDSIGRMVI